MSAGLTMAFLSSEFQCYVQCKHELVDLDWFGEISEESRLQTFLDVAWHGIGTEGNHGNAARCRVFAKDSQGFDPADAGQIDIHQDHLRLVRARKLDAQIADRKS